MSLNFVPKSEKDLRNFDPLPAGEYPFTILESGIVLSKSAKNAGKAMVRVKLNVHGPNGQDRHVYDYFADWFSEFKLKHCCETIGLGPEYAKGSIDPADDAWQGHEGYVKLKVKEADGNYEAKNEVVDYLPEEHQKVESLMKPKAAAQPPADSDDVPF